MKNYLIILISVLALSLNAQVTKKMNGNYEFLGNTTFDSYIYIAPPPTPAASFLFLQSALTGAVEQAMSIQVIDGLAPYVEIKTPAKTTGTATTTLTLNPDSSRFYSQLAVDLTPENTSPDSVITKGSDSTLTATATVGLDAITGNVGLVDTLSVGYIKITVVNTGDVVAGTGITTAMISRDSRYNGSSAIDITADPQIADGFDGQVIKITGLSDTNTLTLDDATGLQLSGGVSFVLGVGDVIQLHYVSSLDLWVEDFRSDN